MDREKAWQKAPKTTTNYQTTKRKRFKRVVGNIVYLVRFAGIPLIHRLARVRQMQ
jgi:hypothetical protein